MQILPLTALRAFQMVAEHLSFTRAAEALHVTQSAVSQQVAQLEERVGKRLVERSGRALRLTAQGELLAAACQRSFSALERTLQRVSRGSDGQALQFKLPPTFAMKWLMPRLPGFQVLHPQVELHINTSVQPVDFESEDVDVGMQRASEPDPGLYGISVMDECGILVCSPRLWGRRKTRVAELATMTLLHSANRPDDWPAWLAAAGVPHIDGNSGLKFENAALAYQAAIDELGVMIAQRALVEDDLRSGRLVTPVPMPVRVKGGYYLSYPPDRPRSERVHAFEEWVVREAEAAEG